MNLPMIIVVCLVVQKSVTSYEFDDPEFDWEKPDTAERCNRVLVCLKTDNQLTALTKFPKHTDLRFTLIDSYPELNIEYHSVKDCPSKIEEEPQTIVAVVAPKPLSMSSEIPIYFFDTSFDKEDVLEMPKYFKDDRLKESKESPDIDAFPNGVFPLRDNWESIKYALSNYIAKHGWKRIAIVSDDSYYSQAFETKLVEHLMEKELVVKAKRCVSTRYGCNFERIMKYFRRNRAYIIIANIHGANVKNLVKAAQSSKMLSSRYVWLVRDWPFEDHDTGMFKNMVSFTLSPLAAPGHKFDHDGPHLNSVWQGLKLISLAIRSQINETVKERLDYYHRFVYDNMRNNTSRCDRSKLYIRKFTSGELVNMHTTEIYNSGDVCPYPKDSELANVADWNEFCLQRSTLFESPCNDTWIIVICVVWLMLIVMMTLLAYFFNRCVVWS